MESLKILCKSFCYTLGAIGCVITAIFLWCVMVLLVALPYLLPVAIVFGIVYLVFF